MREVVYENEYAKVIKINENEYEVHTLSVRDEDGIKAKDWSFNCLYTNHYSRDWLGHTYSNHYNPQGLKNFAYEMAMKQAKQY